MKNASFIQALVVAALLGVAARAPAADPGESYQRAYALCDAGMKEVEAGHRDAAMGKLKAAQSLIQKISQSQPHWQPALVAYKLQKIENVLKDLGSAHAQQRTVVPGGARHPRGGGLSLKRSFSTAPVPVEQGCDELPGKRSNACGPIEQITTGMTPCLLQS